MQPVDIANLGTRIAANQPNSPEKLLVPGSEGGAGVFGDIFHSAAQQVQRLDTEAQSAVVGLMNGSGVEVHDAMIATQRSDLAFQLALQVRNKAVAAYQQMMQMQF